MDGEKITIDDVQADEVYQQAEETMERLRELYRKPLRLTRKKGQTIYVGLEKYPVTITKGKSHLSIPAGVPVEWEGKPQMKGTKT